MIIKSILVKQGQEKKIVPVTIKLKIWYYFPFCFIAVLNRNKPVKTLKMFCLPDIGHIIVLIQCRFRKVL